MGPGIDGKLRPANSYLVGYAPFETEQLWVPLVTLATRLKYKSDFSILSRRQDAWQTSRQAYRLKRGDCEDHSILLADWLIELGYDARVVIGEQNWSGHAWVVVFKDGKQHLIEATKKDATPQFRPVRNKFAYRPYVMFNRDSFWRNSGGKLTTSYSSGSWMKTSRFEVYEPIEELEW
ncbi:MAG: transglutaminase-like domain-containing protein [Candidatus Omnitrophica bacterium]|nr:transglutaminase-like domain-containing protein [Candidatus Omnitrophota bacterium]MBU1997823.1 transglutaminase-like domain-containing protein [Candidatus Omnitrophota bacterium]MBU4334257.1 transglutaminase-like domain-containing protein [Candidatus Omnitrophota bacterium]